MCTESAVFGGLHQRITPYYYSCFQFLTLLFLREKEDGKVIERGKHVEESKSK